MPDLATAKQFQFIGGDLSLDFCNTMGGRRGAVEREYLDSWLNYVAWCHQAGLLNKSQAERCLDAAEREPAQAHAVVGRAIELREAIFRIFAAVIASRSPSQSDLALLNSELAHSLGRHQLSFSKGQRVFAWQWSVREGALDQPLGPIAHAAARLLTDEHSLAHVRMCNSDTCGWLFVDSSKNHSRRWCDMRDCGNRAKIRRHRLKQRRVNPASRV